MVIISSSNTRKEVVLKFSSSMKDLSEPVKLECVSSVVQASQFCGNLSLFLAVDCNNSMENIPICYYKL